VGKKAKRKQRLERHCNDVEAALAGISVTTSTAFAAHLFDRIRAEASGRLAEILADSSVAAREGLDEITTHTHDVLERCAALRAEAEHDRAAVRDVLVAMQATANDFETRARAHVEDVSARGGASLARLEETWAEASIRLEGTQRAIDEQVQQFGKQVAGRVALVTTEADRAVQRFARLRVENAADALGPPDEGTAEDAIWRELARPPLTGEADPEAIPEDDEYFFSRLAAELRVDDQDDSPTSAHEDATQG